MIINNPLISVIVPVYNVEAYLATCLDSICSQTYENLEILIIDDESPDLCGRIADRYAAKDPRIRVFHIKNCGAAGARNVGLDHCTGDYIMFVDSDDWLEENCIGMLLETILREDCQVVQCQFADEYRGSSIPHEIKCRQGRYTACQFARDMLYNWEDILLWNKLFDRSSIGDIRFEEGHCIDDEFFTYQVVMRIKDLAVIPDCLYHYRQRRSGAMNSRSKTRQRLMDQLEFATRRYTPLTKTFPSLKTEILTHLIQLLILVMRKGARFGKVYKEARKHLLYYGLRAIFDKDIDPGLKKSILLYLVKRRSSITAPEPDHKARQDYYY